MTPAQKYLFWREWNLAKKWLMAHGTTPADAEKKRVRLIIDALGYGKSMTDWKRWTNAELDKCLAKFRTIHDGGNLDAQLDAEEQPGKRLGKMEAEVWNLVREVYPPVAGEDSDFKWKNMLNGISRRINHCAFAEIKTEKQMGTVRQALRAQLARNEARVEAHAASEAVDPNDPF